MVRIMKCSCVNAVQDKMYGKGKRLFNRCKPGSTQKVYRCTVCLHEVEV